MAADLVTGREKYIYIYLLDDEIFEELLVNDCQEHLVCTGFGVGFGSLDGKLGLRSSISGLRSSRYKETGRQTNLYKYDSMSEISLHWDKDTENMSEINLNRGELKN